MDLCECNDCSHRIKIIHVCKLFWYIKEASRLPCSCQLFVLVAVPVFVITSWILLSLQSLHCNYGRLVLITRFKVCSLNCLVLYWCPISSSPPLTSITFNTLEICLFIYLFIYLLLFSLFDNMFFRFSTS